MRKSKFTEVQICNILKQAEKGEKVADICRQHAISEATFYSWRKQYAGMESAMIKEMKDLKAENARLKKMYAEAQMDADILKELIEKKL